MMHLGLGVVILSSLIICVTAVILLWSKTYDEGPLGHLALATLIFGSVITLGGVALGNVEYVFLPESVLFRAGTAVLTTSVLLRHLGWFARDRRSQSANNARDRSAYKDGGLQAQ